MALAPGARLGVYEVVALLGAGGMGEVYRARDPRLDRTVELGFNDKTWFAGTAAAYERLHVVERYRRLDMARMEIAVTFEDPETLRSRSRRC